MLSIRIIAVGKLKEKYLSDAFAEYSKRLKPYCNFSVMEINEERLPDNPSNAQICAALNLEGERIKHNIIGAAIPLCIEGKQMTSEDFAKNIESAMMFPGAISLIIGSSHGLSENIKILGSGLSISRMTLPHQMVRVVLVEQIYRAFQIISNTKYHK